MTQTRVRVTTVTDTTNLKRDVSEVIDHLDPSEVPVLDLIGKDSLAQACTQIKHEWMEQSLPARSTTLRLAYVAGSGTMDLVLNGGRVFWVDDLLLMGHSVYRVTAGPPDSDSISVVYLGGAADAGAVAGTVVRCMARAKAEGALASTDTRKEPLVFKHNFTQILEETYLVTGSMKVISRYGYASELAYLTAEMAKTFGLLLEKNIIYGIRSYLAGPPRRSTFGGLLQYIYTSGIDHGWETVVDFTGKSMASAAVSQIPFEAWLRAVWTAGGSVDSLVVIMTAANKANISSWATPRIRTAQDERRGGFRGITYYDTNEGTITFLTSRTVLDSDIIAINPALIGLGPLVGRQLSTEPVASSADGEWYRMLGEYTMEVHKPSTSHGWLYGVG